MEQPTTLKISPVTDSADLAKAHAHRKQFDSNSAWLQDNITDVYARHRGKCICIAGQEVFAADTAAEAIAQAIAAHPHDEGWFTRYIPQEKIARVYAL